MFLTYILQYIFSLFVLFCSGFSGTEGAAVGLAEGVSHGALVFVRVGRSQSGRGVCCRARERAAGPARHSGHWEQPHSKAVSISSEYEVPSVQRKTTFRRLVLVTPQQTPGGADVWQDCGQVMRGTLLVEVQVLKAWWRFSCSLSISPWQLSSEPKHGDLSKKPEDQRLTFSCVVLVLPVSHVGPV